MKGGVGFDSRLPSRINGGLSVMKENSIILVSSYSDSVLAFRGGLVEALVRARFRVRVVTPGGGAVRALAEWACRQGIEVHDVPLQRAGLNPISDLIYLFRLYRYISRFSPVITLPYTIKPVIYGTIAAWLARVPRRHALITGLGYAFIGTRRGVVGFLAERLYRFALTRAHKVYFQNPDDERLFRQRGILPPSVPSVVINGSGVDVGRYTFQPVAKGVQTFLMISRLLGDKGVREFAAAAFRIKTFAPSVRFQLVGWIDVNPDAIAQAELDEWIADGTLEFLGKLDDVRPAIADSTVYVLPSYREGTPRTVLEAMAMGRAIITTDAPGCRETVVDGENGFLVPVKSVDALSEAMLKFIEDPTLAPRMGKRSREIAEEKYDVHKINAVMLREMGITPIAAEESHA